MKIILREFFWHPILLLKIDITHKAGMNIMGLNTKAIRSEFDSANLIIHVSAIEPIHARTMAEGYELSEAVQAILKRYLGNQRGYLIIDYTQIIIEPLCIAEYAAEIKKIITTYLHPDGLARYGFGIGRVTAQLGHSTPIGIPLNLFATRAEAEGYIHGIIAGTVTALKSGR